MEKKRKIWIVRGTETAWDVDSGWKEEAEQFVQEWESQKPNTDWESFAAYTFELELRSKK